MKGLPAIDGVGFFNARGTRILRTPIPKLRDAQSGAIGSLVALRFALTRRNRDKDGAAPEQAAAELPAERPRSAHPVSRKKKRRRRR
jgi:hypothetical protein